MTYNIWYCGSPYSAAEITIFPNSDDEECVTVATTELRDKLLENIRNGIDVGGAISLDDKICYYLEPYEMALTAEQIAEIVEASY